MANMRSPKKGRSSRARMGRKGLIYIENEIGDQNVVAIDALVLFSLWLNPITLANLQPRDHGTYMPIKVNKW